MSITTWRTLIAEALDGDELTHCTLSEQQLDVRFDSGYGGHEGLEFTAWSERYVYFPVAYDGAEWVGRAPRHPESNEPTAHQGGE